VSGPAALRSYRETDLPALHALDGVCFLPDISYTRQELKHFLEHPGAFSIVAEQDGRIAGFAITRSVRRRIHTLDLVAPAVHVITIDVSPTLRRRGIGVQLMQWIIAQAARLGAQALVLEAAVDNRPAHLFYERFGFTVTGTIPGYYNGLVDAFAFERLVLPQEAPATTA
jgi:ribosomal-protein-alanine N-acetyltransferase